ncbi:hypothetical protein TEQG_02922 [Trichophyton equinum CBS 127.97]|uniref:Uncharacterized protein n=1 Tax=Trichophyton equinum (strain ATCC MYA-4606 / CBS 127.97) TaxID=559882 RepID=F2PPS1_TRIEC|nr:hypothetical protein TEQG_02922 [Trichophyton equinum CBS 127.97]
MPDAQAKRRSCEPYVTAQTRGRQEAEKRQRRGREEEGLCTPATSPRVALRIHLHRIDEGEFFLLGFASLYILTYLLDGKKQRDKPLTNERRCIRGRHRQSPDGRKFSCLQTWPAASINNSGITFQKQQSLRLQSLSTSVCLNLSFGTDTQTTYLMTSI